MAATAHHDTGVEEGVGTTALLVAAARAIETHRPDALARDVFAEHFVLAAPASAGWPTRLQQVPDGDANPLWGRFARYFGLRTRVLDDFLLQSVHTAGIRQIVLLGAGLDTRAFRLDWPSRSIVFEIDRTEVLAFKHKVLDGMSATAKAARAPVPVDLRADWVAALADSGFDRSAPSVWLAEGLLFYLPADAEASLIAAVDRLSTRGSALAYEVKLEPDLMTYRDSPLYTSTTRQIGIDLLDLFAKEPRPDSAGALTSKGWSASVHTPFEFTHRHGRGPLPEENDALAGNRWVFAHKP
ncbi:class I SAM-dependent methyltransferase [Streptomyces kunmingensis]|uniref:S-adenosyl-L-methionine-dependent methyltransferase n=1 Tax=Streptomyces kunmingensis TaxID=68225 RepID=A0ABU6CIK4_9ACTN|nr:class I SAM-dependent methyltransferase [Streptomyces kunmingensis]MEB3964555.1 class I SAM-dependent methyltransferase [Streptomyces kunmingensis]